MRVISLKTLKAFWLKHPDAEEPLRAWFKVTTAAGWSNFMTVRNTFGSADTAKVNSGNTVTIFDIGGNKYRLIAVIDFPEQILLVRKVMTHEQYDKEKL